MKTLHTSNQFNSPLSLITVGLLGCMLGVALCVRAFDTGSWWQYLGATLLFILSLRLFKRAVRAKK